LLVAETQNQNPCLSFGINKKAPFGAFLLAIHNQRSTFKQIDLLEVTPMENLLLNRLAAVMLPIFVMYLEWYLFATFGVLGGYLFVSIAYVRSKLWPPEETFKTAFIMVLALAMVLSIFTKDIIVGCILVFLAGTGILSLYLSTRLWRGYC
jgi:hypothetical protein